MQKIKVEGTDKSTTLDQVELGQTFNVEGTEEYYTRIICEQWTAYTTVPCLFLIQHNTGHTYYQVVGLEPKTRVFVHYDTQLIIK